MNEDDIRCPVCGRLLEVICPEEYGDAFVSYIAGCPGSCGYQTELDDDQCEALEALKAKEVQP